MEIFNTKILNNQQRWKRALIYGIGATILSGVVIGIIQHLFVSTFSLTSTLFDFAIAYFIGWIILETGHGVQVKFSILAAVCCTVAIILADMIGFFGLSAIAHPIYSLFYVISDYISLDIINLLFIFSKGLAIYYAYGKARVL